MAMFNSRQQAEPPLLRIEPFKGLNTSVTPTQIDQAQSPDMKNMSTDERGALNQRTGYARIISSLPGKINGAFVYRQTDGTEAFLFAQGNKLYKLAHMPDGQQQQNQEAVWSDDDLNESW